MLSKVIPPCYNKTCGKNTEPVNHVVQPAKPRTLGDYEIEMYVRLSGMSNENNVYYSISPEEIVLVFMRNSYIDTTGSELFGIMNSHYTDTLKIIGYPPENLVLRNFKCRNIDVSQMSVERMKTLSHLFAGLYDVEHIDLSSFDTSHITSMQKMFINCRSLKELDLSTFDTSNVRDMSLMFYGCNKLEKINLSSFNTSKVVKMQNMFAECGSLTAIDLSTFNTPNLEDMSGMFSHCRKLRTLDLSMFDVSKLVSAASAFSYLKLNSLDLSMWRPEKLHRMRSMFGHTTIHGTLDVRHFNKQMLEFENAFSHAKIGKIICS